MEQQLQQERIVIENDDEIEIDLKDLVLEILSFWKWVLFALIIGAVTAYCISRFVMVPQYESTSQFYVLSKSMSITSLADIQTGTSLTNDYMVIVEGRPVLEQVIENLGLDETYSSLKKKVTLNNPSNSRILEITVRDANPSMAKKIADEIARVSVAFIQQKMDQDAPNIIQKGYSDGEPVSPNIMKNTAIGGILGMFLAIAVIVVAYLFNDTIMNADDVQRKLGLNVLGTLPLEEAEYDGEKEMKSVTFENLKKQNYTMKESLRALKTNIQFCGDDICTIVVTSAMPNEGKSTVTMDLARSFSESGKRVLLIDTDMRKSVYVGRLRAVASDGREIYGLSHFLSGQKKLEDVLYGTTIPGLFMIFAGPSVPNPTEILEKKYFTELLNFAKEHFDYVLLDCAPIGAAIDAAVIAKHCDGAILVVAQGMASGRLIQTVKKQMEASGVRVLGAVLNKVRMKKSGYEGGYYGGYYGSYYGNYGEHHEKNA